MLSGFLITGILYDTRKATNFFKVFYARRALRLFPLYFFAVTIVLVGWGPASHPHELEGNPLLYLWREPDASSEGTGSPNFTPYFNCIHFWSLAVEEQFYSLWPLVVFFVLRRRTLMQICAGGILGALVFRVILSASAGFQPGFSIQNCRPGWIPSLRAPCWRWRFEAPGRMRGSSGPELYSVIAVCGLDTHRSIYPGQNALL